MINEKINRKIIALWDKHFQKRNDVYGPLFYDDFKKGGLLFVGVNPSFSLKGFKLVLRDTEYESINPETFFQWGSLSAEEKNIDTCVLIDRHWLVKYPAYFKRFHDIAEYAETSLQHIDIFLYKQTSQTDFLNHIRDKNGLNEFGRDQLALFDEIVKSIAPKVIVIANAFASTVVQEHFKDVLTFDERYGFHVLALGKQKIPIFFSSMLTGQRALDVGSYRRLRWHIKHAVKNYAD